MLLMPISPLLQNLLKFQTSNSSINSTTTPSSQQDNAVVVAFFFNFVHGSAAANESDLKWLIQVSHRYRCCRLCKFVLLISRHTAFSFQFTPL